MFQKFSRFSRIFAVLISLAAVLLNVASYADLIVVDRWLVYASYIVFVIMIVLIAVAYLPFWLKATHMLVRRQQLSLLANMLLAGLVVLGSIMLSNRPRFNKQIDFSQDHASVLSEQSKLVLKKIKANNGQIEIRAYLSDSQVRRSLTRLVGLYNQEWPGAVQVNFLDPLRDALFAKNDAISTRNEMIISVNGRSSKLDDVSEALLTRALIRMMGKTTKSVIFTSGHGECRINDSSQEGISQLAKRLEQTGYKVKDLDDFANLAHLNYSDVLVICGPKTNFSIVERNFLRSYIDRGGSLVTWIDALRPVNVINTLFSEYGLQFNSDFVVLEQGHPLVETIGQNATIVDFFSTTHPITQDLGSNKLGFIATDARTLSYDQSVHGVEWVSIAKSNQENIRVKETYSIEDLRNVNPNQIEQGRALIAVSGHTDGSANNKSLSSRLAVVGSSSFARNASFSHAVNSDFVLNSISYAAHDDHVLSVRPRSDDRGELHITAPMQVYTLLGLCFFYPFIWLGFGLVISHRRRRVAHV